jgi:glutaconate CoA-transferase subunit A
LLEPVTYGAQVVVPPDSSGVTVGAARALIARPTRQLRLVAVPQAGFQIDLLIGAGCVESIENVGNKRGEHGLAPRYTDAVQRGELSVVDGNCPRCTPGCRQRRRHPLSCPCAASSVPLCCARGPTGG